MDAPVFFCFRRATPNGRSGPLLEEREKLSRGGAGESGERTDDVAVEKSDVAEPAEDLLERVRDLIVVGSVGLAAKNVLRDIPADQLERMRLQVERFGKAESEAL
jgi:DNA polymerase-3 subunit gamma/tau